MTSLLAHAIKGQLAEHLEAEAEAVRTAAAKTIRDSTRAVQLEIREKVVAAFAGSRSARRVGNAIRSRIYENDNAPPAGVIWSRFGRREGGQFVDYLLPFTTGATLRPRNSRWLYISLEKGRRARRQRRLSVEQTKNLRFVKSGDGRRIWIVRDTRTRSTLIAVLVRVVRLPRRLALDAPTRAEQAFAGALVRNIEEAVR